MHALIGVMIGILINHLIIRPIEQKRWRKRCIEDGLVKERDKEESCISCVHQLRPGIEAYPCNCCVNHSKYELKGE